MTMLGLATDGGLATCFRTGGSVAGYFVVLSDSSSVTTCLSSGTYATILRPRPVGAWSSWALPAEATMADYACMQAGDHIYFFSSRQVYGIGRLVNVGNDCKYQNYPNSSALTSVGYNDVQEALLWDAGEGSENQRWICTFEPDPVFFANRVDMDDLLSSDVSAFRVVRTMANRTFIRFDDEEDLAFRSALLRANRSTFEEDLPTEEPFAVLNTSVHERIADLTAGGAYSMSVTPLLTELADGTAIRHEMAVEAGVVAQLTAGEPQTTAVFGEWDYISHQVPASPMKPSKWMDSMDMFGYAFMEGYEPVVSRYMVGEVKKDVAVPDDVEQVMRYVDWVKDEYAGGDYSMVRAFLVAHDFDDGVWARVASSGLRLYTIGRRPARTLRWGGVELRLVRYSFSEATGLLQFEDVPRPSDTQGGDAL